MYTGDSPNCQMSMVAMAGSTSCQYFSFSARAAEMQGITISATTAGRMPLKMRIITVVVLKMSEGHGYQHHDDKRGEDCGKCTHQAAFYFMQLVADEYGYIDSKNTGK